MGMLMDLSSRIFTNYSREELLTITLWSGSWRRATMIWTDSLADQGGCYWGYLTGRNWHSLTAIKTTKSPLPLSHPLYHCWWMYKIICQFGKFLEEICFYLYFLCTCYSLLGEDNKLVWLEIDNWARVSPGHQYRPRQSGARTNTSQATQQPPNKLPTITDCENF